MVFSLTLNPLGNVAYVIVYLTLLFVLFSGLGYFWGFFRRGLVTSKDRSRIFLLSFTLVILIMLRSLQALGGVEALLVIVLAAIIFFYIGRTA